MNNTFEISYLGHSCFLIRTINGKNLLVDPWLRTNKSAAIMPEELHDIDMIAVTHGAWDHLGDAIEICKQNNAHLFCGAEVALHAIDKGIKEENITKMIYGTALTYQNIGIRTIVAHHISMVEYKEQILSGSALSYIFRMEDGTGIYFSGDTCIFSDLKLYSELYPVDIAIIGMDNLPGCPIEMSGEEAALVAKWMDVDVAIPMHYPPDSLEPKKFATTLEKTRVKPVILKPGQVFSYERKSYNGKVKE